MVKDAGVVFVSNNFVPLISFYQTLTHLSFCYHKILNFLFSMNEHGASCSFWSKDFSFLDTLSNKIQIPLEPWNQKNWESVISCAQFQKKNKKLVNLHLYGMFEYNYIIIKFVLSFSIQCQEFVDMTLRSIWQQTRCKEIGFLAWQTSELIFWHFHVFCPCIISLRKKISLIVSWLT